MKILVILNYYYPYVSGLSEYARLLCEELSKSGNEVTVLAGNHAKLETKECINGVNVVRAPVWFRVSKGTISPQFIIWAVKYAQKADVVNLHLPMLEAGLLAMMLPKEKLICTYHCDVNLPNGILNNFILRVMDISHKIALKRTQKIVVNTIEYMEYSRVANKYVSKMSEIAPPIKQLPKVKRPEHDKFRIGFCGRIVEEKGIDILIKAFELLQKEENNIVLVIGGDYKEIAGGSIYPKLMKYIEQRQIDNIYFTGKIAEENMAEFYASLDVFVLPSINSLESFGMVQVEAMMCGTPVIASDLLGVRTIVKRTGMGVIAKAGDAEDLKKCILKVKTEYTSFVKERELIQRYYGVKKSAASYEKLMKRV